MFLSFPEIIYVVAVLGIGSYALFRTLAFLQDTRKLRMKKIEQRHRFEAVPAHSPIQDARKVALERGRESIQTHFTVMRRLLLPIIGITTFTLALLPFVAETSASIVAAVVAVLAGIALRPFLENAIAGIVISSSGLVRIGDTVRIDDCYGTVEDITATHTAVKVWDWRRYLVPNGQMLSSSFLNYSLFDTYQCAYVEFYVAPDEDLDEVRDLALSLPARSRYLLDQDPPDFWVMRIEKDAVCCWLAAWARTPSDAWSLATDIRTMLLREFRQRGISLSLQRLHWSGDSQQATASAAPQPTLAEFPPIRPGADGDGKMPTLAG